MNHLPHKPPAQPAASARAAFTMVEMVVVAAVILIIAAAVLPAASSMWAQRKIAGAEGVLSGVLRTARRQAMVAGRGESGVFFAVDASGAQSIYPIEQVTQPQGAGVSHPDLVSQNRFVITDDRAFTLPPPMRVVPRYVIDDAASADSADVFSTDELANNSFPDPEFPGFDEQQRHRNFFTMVFSTDGRLLVGRDVLIHDTDDSPQPNGDGVGDRTGLRVGFAPANSDVPTYHPQSGPRKAIDPTGGGATLKDLITDNVGVAVNLPSVDGLLLYDDAQFNRLPGMTDQQRDFLLRTGRPFFVNRLTGTVIRGPLGENVTP